MSKKSKPGSKLLFIDIETSPNVGYFWRSGHNLDITPESIIAERKIICIGYKFEGDKAPTVLTWDKDNDDTALLKKIIPIINQASALVYHNGDRFDKPWIKGRIAVLGLDPLTQIHSIDTLKLSRNNFYFNSHKLDYLSKLFKLGSKKATGGYSLWTKVMGKDKAALKEMAKYCAHDVDLTEKLFNRLKKYVDRLPIHYGILKDKGAESCSICGGTLHGNGVRAKKLGVYPRFRCADCGHSSTGTTRIKE